MSSRSLFILILKVIGLFFLRDFVIAVPQFISMVSLVVNSYDAALSPFIAMVLSVGIYGYLCYLLLFKTEWLLGRLKLTSGVEEEVFAFNMHRSSILAIVVLVIGALMVVNAVPSLVHQLILYFQYFRVQSGFPNLYSKPDNSLLVIYSLQVIIGLLVIGYQQRIVSYLELRRRQTTLQSMPEQEEDVQGS